MNRHPGLLAVVLAATAACATPGSSCGDGVCNVPDESSASCPWDCSGTNPRCGDGTCNGTETMSTCPMDCTGTTCGARNQPCCTGGACQAGLACTANVCTGSACTAPLTQCGSSCVNLQADPNNCGTCGHACTMGQACSSGSCGGSSTCGGSGQACCTGNVCNGGLTCSGGTCTGSSTCGNSGQACCTGSVCNAGLTCSGGTCQTSGTGSRAGLHCTNDGECGGMPLTCETEVPNGFCTGDCTNNASQATERAACGGTGSTCLTQGDPDPRDPMATSSLCTHACSATGTSSGCLAGQVCTGWWYTHSMGTPDTTGCFPFCSNSSQCTGGQVCNPRVGECGTTGVVMSRLPDGSPCTPSTMNTQCRGICFRIDDAGHGICGSFVDTRVSMTCVDDPTNLDILAPRNSSMQTTDNLGLCIFKACNCDRDCTGATGYVCVSSSGTTVRTCGWPDTTMGEHGTPTCT